MDKKNVKKIMNCPKCDATLDIQDDASVGEIIICPNCGTNFEIPKKDEFDVEIKSVKGNNIADIVMTDVGDEP